MKPVPQRILELARQHAETDMEEYLLRLKIAHEACRLQMKSDSDKVNQDLYEEFTFVVEEPN